MKKYVVAILVLCMASLATAGLQLSVNGAVAPDEITIKPSDWVSIDVMDDLLGGRADFILYTDVYGLADLSNPRLGSGAGNFPATFEGPYAGTEGSLGVPQEFYVNQAWAVGTAPQPGVIFLFDLHCGGEGDVLVELWDDRAGYDAPVDTLIIHQIPEPATLSILGLGGLLLRRKK